MKEIGYIMIIVENLRNILSSTERNYKDKIFGIGIFINYITTTHYISWGFAVSTIKNFVLTLNLQIL